MKVKSLSLLIAVIILVIALLSFVVVGESDIIVTIAKGESFEILNLTGKTMRLRSSGAVDLTWFYKDGRVKEKGNYYTLDSLEVSEGERFHGVVSGNELKFWMSNEDMEMIKKLDTPIIKRSKGESLKFKNTTDSIVYLRSSGAAELTWFNKDGTLKEKGDYYTLDGLEILIGEEINITVKGSELKLWMLKIAKDTNQPLQVQSELLPDMDEIISSGYIYDVFDPGLVFELPIDDLKTITDKESLVETINYTIDSMTAEQKMSPTGIDRLTLLVEEAVSQASCKKILGNTILINHNNIKELEASSDLAKEAAEKTMIATGILAVRDINKNIKFKTEETEDITIKIDSSAIDSEADNINIETLDYSISLSAESIKANTKESPLIINVSKNLHDSDEVFHSSYLASNSKHAYLSQYVNSNNDTLSKSNSLRVTFNKPIIENIKLSLPVASGDPKYQAILKSDGSAVGGKYNPATGYLETKIKDSDTYTIKENKVDFTDIKNKSKEMQESIKILASKGIIKGTSDSIYSPDAFISRAEIAALIIRTLSKLDFNADGGFSDVKKNDWFYSIAGSAKNYGIMKGTSTTTFAPKLNITKDQIVSVAARTLRNEMKYKNPVDIEKFLSSYTDRKSIPDWGKMDIAMATRENLVVKRTDGKFIPQSTMTRGDAAVILYRLFNKIW